MAASPCLMSPCQVHGSFANDFWAGSITVVRYIRRPVAEDFIFCAVVAVCAPYIRSSKYLLIGRHGFVEFTRRASQGDQMCSVGVPESARLSVRRTGLGEGGLIFNELKKDAFRRKG